MHNMHYVHYYYFTALTALCTQELLHGSYIAFTGNLVSKEQGTELFSCCLNVYAWIGVQVTVFEKCSWFSLQQNYHIRVTSYSIFAADELQIGHCCGEDRG